MGQTEDFGCPVQKYLYIYMIWYEQLISASSEFTTDNLSLWQQELLTSQPVGWSHRNSPCLPGHVLIFLGFGLLYRVHTDLAHAIPHVTWSPRPSWQSCGTNMHQKAATTNSSDTHNTRPAYPRNRKSSSAASTLSWQGPHTSGCLPRQQKLNDFNFCMLKNVPIGLRAKYITPPINLQYLPTNFQPQRPNCPGT